MKKGQSVIILTMKDTGTTYLFGSLAAIYGMFDSQTLGITYSALRNAVSTYIKINKINENGNASVMIYDNARSRFTLNRGPLLLAEK
jgi:hypothetical protein